MEVDNKLEFVLRHPFTYCIYGPTQCGKTTYVLDLIANRDKIISEKFDRIIYLYGIDQPKYHEFSLSHPDVVFTKDMEALDDITNDGVNSLLCIDDKLVELAGEQNDTIIDWFVRGSHHKNCS